MNVRELARTAGLSHMTVSRALNGSPHVAPATRERVLALASEYGYAIHGPARGLATGTTGTVGILYPYHSLRQLESSHTRQLMHDVRLALEQGGTDAIIAGYDTASRGDEDVARLCAQRKVDAVVVIGYEVSHEALNALGRRGYRYLCVNPPQEPWITEHPSVVVDQELGGALAARELRDSGVQRVAVVHEDVAQFHHRVRGFERAWGSPVPSLILPDGAYETAVSFAEHHLSRLSDYEGLYVGSDVSAIGIMNALQSAGRAVPGDIRIVGFDDIESARYCRPSLTTVHQPRQRVAEAVRAWVAAPDSETRFRFDPRLVRRESSR